VIKVEKSTSHVYEWGLGCMWAEARVLGSCSDGLSYLTN